MLKNLITVISGTGLGQLVLLIAAPILTRLVSPEQFGEFSVFMYIVAIASIIGTLGYEASIVNAKNERDADIYGGATILMTALICGLILFPALVILSSMTERLNIPVSLIILSMIATVIANIFLVLQFVSVRKNHYRNLALGSLVGNAGRAIGQVGLAFISGGAALALALGDTLGRACGNVTVAKRGTFLRTMKATLQNRGDILPLLSADRRNAFFYMPSNLCEAALIWFPVPFFAILYGVETAGLVALIQRLFSAPVALFGRSLADVYHGRTQDLVNDRRLITLTLKIIALIIVAFIPVTIILMLLGERGFAFLLGEQWGAAGPVAFIMAPVLAFQIAIPMMTRFCIMIRHPEIKLIAFILMLLTLCGLGALTAQNNYSFETTLMMLSMTLACGYALFFTACFVVSHLKILPKSA